MSNLNERSSLAWHGTECKRDCVAEAITRTAAVLAAVAEIDVGVVVVVAHEPFRIRRQQWQHVMASWRTPASAPRSPAPPLPQREHGHDVLA